MRNLQFTLCLITLFLISCVNIVKGQEVDSTTSQLLAPVTVIGFDSPKMLRETPGAIAIIGPERLEAYDGTSVVFAANTLPGIRFEERSPGSYRVAVRGSSLRAPFGVRNVKTYWNGIPYTRPTGESPINLLDPINFGRMEVIRGPAGSIYGAGNGGVLNIGDIGQRKFQDQLSFQHTQGSFGLQRYVGVAEHAGDKGGLLLRYAHQEADGYRDNSALRRDNLQASGRFTLDQGHQVAVNLLYSDIQYGIPGGLTAEQRDENPRQVRPSILGQATGLSSQNLLMGFTSTYDQHPRFENVTTLYGNLESFENTFFDFRRESRQSGGGRTRSTYKTKLGQTNFRFSIGGEFQRGFDIARNFENLQGQAGALNFDDELTTNRHFLFAKTEANLPGQWQITAGLSRNVLDYDINRLVDNGLDSAFRLERSFDPQWIPRLGLAKTISPDLTIHASISSGFSAPVIEEIRTNEGTLNTALQAEKGLNTEIGARGTLLNNKLAFDVSAFYFRLDDTIVREETPRGTVVFANAGNTDQAGIELLTTWYAIATPTVHISSLTWQVAYTYHDFAFDDYVDDGEDFSGNDLTGVAPHTLAITADLAGTKGWYLSATYNHTGRMPLNDANTVHADGFQLVLVKAGYSFAWQNGPEIEVFAGVNNLLDERYSLGNDLNAFGQRYFQPAPERNYYAGIKARIGD